MNVLLISARAVHFASAMLIFGELVFALVVAQLSLGAQGWTNTGAFVDVSRFVRRMLACGLVAALASSVAWLAAEVVLMSGLPTAQALRWHNFRVVLTETNFGHVWLLRLAILILAGLILLTLRRSPRGTSAHGLARGALIVAGLYLGALAWAGHAAAGEGTQRVVHLMSDVVHLLCTGAWVGALPALIVLLGSALPSEQIVSSVSRFSTMGATSVIMLAVSGVVNSCLLVDSVPSLFASEYGRLLVTKILLFAMMVAVAAINRSVLAPRLGSSGDRAARSIRRNAILEAVGGVVVVCIVAVLGVTMPAMDHSAGMLMNQEGRDATHHDEHVPSSDLHRH